ncbi:hypothetical protein OAC46_03750 [Flavobacteriaceae bacterium]|nr:hypothetical protein [Flavobacteriaceae bacterium]
MNEPLLQVQSEVNGTTHIDIEEIRNFTNGLIYPLSFLDFETIGPPIIQSCSTISSFNDPLAL